MLLLLCGALVRSANIVNIACCLSKAREARRVCVSRDPLSTATQHKHVDDWTTHFSGTYGMINPASSVSASSSAVRAKACVWAESRIPKTSTSRRSALAPSPLSSLAHAASMAL